MSSVPPSPEPVSGMALTATAYGDSFSDVDSELGELVRGLAAPPAARPREREPEVERELAPGSSIAGHFAVVRKLGMGGMGVVYLARDARLDRVVAIKLLSTRRSDLGSKREAGTARLEREAQAMAQLAHPNVVTVHEVGRHDDGVYVAMEFVDGGTARQWLAERPRSIGEIVEVYLQAARGLAAAHAAGFVHRDFKPDNVLVGRDARVRVADFGLARTMTSGEHPITQASARELESVGQSRPSIPQLTATDAVVGTPGYMAPEQFAGHELGPGIDQFAFGIALFEALWGQRPYGTLPSWAASAGDLQVPARGVAGRVPSWLRQTVLQAIELDPRRRFGSMQQLALALERGRDRGRRRIVALVAGAGITAAVAVGAQLGSSARESPCSDSEPIAAAVWNERVRAGLDARVADDDPLTQRTWEVAVPMLDAWVGRWVDDRQASCIATRVHGSQSEQLLDRSVACLDDRLADVGALVEALASDSRARANADSHIASLRETSPCRDSSYLLAQVGPPEDPSVREDVEHIEDELRRIRLGREADDHEGLGERMDALTEAAQRTAYLPSIAAVGIESGRLAMDQDRREDARKLLREAYFTARSAGDVEDADDAAMLLAFLSGTLGSDRATAEIWLDHVGADLQRGAASPLREVTLLTARSQVLQRAGAQSEAIATAREALAAAIACSAPQVRVLEVRAELAGALDDAGHHNDAIAEYDTLLADTEALYGPDHARVAMVLTNRGLAHYYQQQSELAVVDQQRALAINLAHGELDSETSGALLNLGLAYLDLGRFDDAKPPVEQALEIWRRIDAKSDQALALNALGWIEIERHEYVASLAHYREALAIDQELLPPGHPQLANTWGHVADAHFAMGDIAAAIDGYTHARAVWAAPGMGDHPARAASELGLGRCYLALDRLDEAQRMADAVVELAAHAEVEPTVVVRGRFLRAQLAERRGRHADAVAEARLAFELSATIHGDRIGEDVAEWLREHDAG